MRFFFFVLLFFLASCSLMKSNDDVFSLSYSICNRLGFNTLSSDNLTPQEAFDYCSSEVQKAIMLYRLERD